MQVIRSVEQWRALLPQGILGLVPTMGALHMGHLSLVRKSLEENEKTVVSIFVNSTQFNDPDDYQSYPNTWEADCQNLEKMQVDYIFSPDYRELYPDNYRYRVTENKLSKILCGAHRLGHFDGVLSVVMKLLNIIAPNRAYFGKKDYQQFLLVREMAKAFFLNVEIIGCDTVREKDGLAMSSRNRLLTPQDREKASNLYHTLKSSSNLRQTRLKLEENGFVVDYIEDLWQRRFVAAHLGKVRLIDNVPLEEIP